MLYYTHNRRDLTSKLELSIIIACNHHSSPRKYTLFASKKKVHSFCIINTNIRFGWIVLFLTFCARFFYTYVLSALLISHPIVAFVDFNSNQLHWWEVCSVYTRNTHKKYVNNFPFSNSFTLVQFSFLNVINYQLFKKYKLLGNNEINYLTIILTISFEHEFELHLNKWGQYIRFFHDCLKSLNY